MCVRALGTTYIYYTAHRGEIYENKLIINIVILRKYTHTAKTTSFFLTNKIQQHDSNIDNDIKNGNVLKSTSNTGFIDFYVILFTVQTSLQKIDMKAIINA